MGWVEKVLSFSLGDFLELLNNIGRREVPLRFRDSDTVTGTEKGELFIEASRKSGKSLMAVHQILEHVPEDQQTKLLQQICDGMIIPDSWLKAAKRSPTMSATSAIEEHTRAKVEAIARDIDKKIMAHCDPHKFGPKKAAYYKKRKGTHETTVFEDTRDGREVAATADIHGRQRTEEDKAEARRQVKAAQQAKKTLKKLSKPGRQVVGVDLRHPKATGKLRSSGGKTIPPQDTTVVEEAEVLMMAEMAETAVTRLGWEDIEVSSISVKPHSSREVREKIVEMYKNGHLTDEAAKQLIEDIDGAFIELPETKPKEEGLFDEDEDGIDLDDTEMI